MTNDDLNFLTASTLNLYLESLRRGGRLLLIPDDIPRIYDLIQTFTNPLPVKPVEDTARSRQLTDEEREKVLSTFGQAHADQSDVA